MKKIRKAVRTFLIDNNKVVAIRYIREVDKDFYDIPGGKIEENETSKEAAIREFKEETGMNVFNLKFIGNLIAEYPEKIFDFDIYVTNGFQGSPKNNEENEAFWIDIQTLIKVEKQFPIISLLEDFIKKDIKDFKFHFGVDDNHKIDIKKVIE